MMTVLRPESRHGNSLLAIPSADGLALLDMYGPDVRRETICTGFPITSLASSPLSDILVGGYGTSTGSFGSIMMW